MSSFAKISKIGESKPYYGIAKLPLGFYPIESFRLVKNKYSKDESEKSLLVELKSEVLFLPKYFSSELSEKDVENLNTDGEVKFLYFGGRRVKNK